MTPSRNSSLIRALLPLLVFILLGLLGYKVVDAINVRRSCGLLELKVSDKSAVVSISAINKQAELLGTGNTSTYLSPGDYYVFARGSGLQASQIVHVALHKTTKTTLLLSNPKPALPSPESINFMNTKELIDNGISATQVSNIEQMLFMFSSSAKTITIARGSVRPGPHDRNSSSPWFNMTFIVNIDNSGYSALLEYSGLITTKLTMNDSSGAQVFSGQLPTVPGE